MANKVAASSTGFAPLNKKILLFGLKALVTLALFALLFRPETFGLRSDFWGEEISVSGLLGVLGAVETHHIAFWLGFALVAKLIGMAAGMVRWRLLLEGQGIHIPFGYLVQSWFVGRFIGIFLPGTVGLDGYRLYDSASYTGEVIKCTTVIAVEKLIGIIALTLLVFVTFPLGLRLLDFRPVVLIVCMAAFGALVVASLLTLLNPRVIQVLVAVIPRLPEVPGGQTASSLPRRMVGILRKAALKTRSVVDKLGSAATAYSGKRGILLWAVFFGIVVHLGTCLMYFGAMSAIRADNTTIFDILFTSPLMIWGTVLGPSVGGEGIREAVFTAVLGGKSGPLHAFLIGHLGWWVGELVPFLIGLPIFMFHSRPDKEELRRKLAAARAESSSAYQARELAPEAVRQYQTRLLNIFWAGVLAGLFAGALIGLGEAFWLRITMSDSTEMAALWWGPLVYGLCFMPVGVAVAAAWAFLYLLRDRFPRSTTTFALCVGVVLAAGVLVFGYWRFKRDILGDHGLNTLQMLTVFVLALGAGLVSTVVISLALRPFHSTRKTAVLSGLAAYAMVVLVGAGLAAISTQPAPSISFAPPMQGHGPNIIVIVCDALRADYLSLYSGAARAQTPNLDRMAQEEGVLYTRCFAQASWTKPSFACIYTGLYPEQHTATSKQSSLPQELTTLAEVLSEQGYYTKGYANNPNVTAAFQYNQGFVDYTDLKPDLYFGATRSVSKLALYEVLRRIWERAPFRAMNVRNYYQPADVVTEEAITWFDSSAVPEGTPFFLVLHYMETHDPYMDHNRPGVGYARVKIPDPDPGKYREPFIAAYESEIEFFDKYLGEVTAALRERGLYDDSLIVVTADHGEEFYDHEGWWHGMTLYEEMLHVPLVMKLPQQIRAGEIDESIVRHIDLAPTFISLAGADPPPAMFGESLLTSDYGDTNPQIGYAYAETDHERNVVKAVRTTDKKLIHANEDNPRGLEPVEFFDLLQDPGEKTNLANELSEEQKNLEKLFNDIQDFVEENAAEPSLIEEIPEELKEQMENVGYM
jgi:arylsulfatase A-like enzyme/uncharacterized membrane protein YbhN (UPF0104 family)